jgi:hypothetical protein
MTVAAVSLVHLVDAIANASARIVFKSTMLVAVIRNVARMQKPNE